MAQKKWKIFTKATNHLGQTEDGATRTFATKPEALHDWDKCKAGIARRRGWSVVGELTDPNGKKSPLK